MGSVVHAASGLLAKSFLSRTENLESEEEQPDNENYNSEVLKTWKKIAHTTNHSFRECTIEMLEFLVGYSLFLTEVITGYLNGDLGEANATLIFFILSSTVVVLLEYNNVLSNPGGYGSFEKNWYMLVYKLFCNLTPFKLFEIWRIHKQNESDEKEIIKVSKLHPNINPTKKSILKLIEIRRRNLEKTGFDYKEAFINDIPMGLIQFYFMFQSNKLVKICQIGDCTSLLLIIKPFYTACMKDAKYSLAITNYKKSEHFFDFQQSKYQRFFNLETKHDSLVLKFIHYFLFLVQRFYLVGFALTIHGSVAIGVIIVILITQWLLLRCFPILRSNFENPPLGVSTKLSYFVDRLVNLFSPTMLNFDFFKCSFPFWFSLYHCLPYAASLCLIVTSGYFIKLNPNGDSNIPPLSNCTETPISSSSFFSIINTFQHFVFIAQEIISSHVVTYKDFFSAFSVLLGTFIIFLSYSFIYSLIIRVYHKEFNRRFPVQVAFDYFKPIFEENWSDGTGLERKMILAFIIIKDSEFEKISNKSTRRNEKYLSILDEAIVQALHKILMKNLTRDLNERFECSEQGVETAMNNFKGNFTLEELQQEQVQLGLNYLFNNFPDLMSKMSSFRISKILNILDKSIIRDDEDRILENY